MSDDMNTMELNMENLETVAGGTPMSIPGGKHSGRKNMETSEEIMKWLGEKGNDLLESLGMKQKPVDNKIYDRRSDEWWNS